MAYKIKISKTAKKTFEENIYFLKTYWTEKEIKKFILKTEEIIEILKYDPRTFKKWEEDNSVHKIKVMKQITLFYEIKDNTVILLLFWNNYQNPNNLKRIISTN